jgi:putative SOS response-associated peptidase YedK
VHPVVRLDAGQRVIQPGIWGFSAAAPGRPPLFNARAETAPIKDSFRDAFVNGRCVIPADGFYEWAGSGDARRPFWLHRADGKLLLFAGLYQLSPTGGRFTILTTGPNAIVSALHDRMPVVLAPDQVDRWLRRGDPGLLRPAPDDTLVATPVSPRVNSVRNDDPACLEPPPTEAPPVKRQLDLF